MNKINKSFKLNKKGFSLIELIVVIALMVVATTIASMPLVNIYKARAKSAAEQVNTMLSQSKIDALSGVENEMLLYFDKDANKYMCRLAYSSGSQKGEFYKTEEFGNKNLTIGFGGQTLRQTGQDCLIVKFDRQTGEITHSVLCRYKTKDTVISGDKLKDEYNPFSDNDKNCVNFVVAYSTINYIWFGGSSKDNCKYKIYMTYCTGLIDLKFVG